MVGEPLHFTELEVENIRRSAAMAPLQQRQVVELIDDLKVLHRERRAAASATEDLAASFETCRTVLNAIAAATRDGCDTDQTASVAFVGEEPVRTWLVSDEWAVGNGMPVPDRGLDDHEVGRSSRARRAW